MTPRRRILRSKIPMHSDRKNRRARLQAEKTKLVGFAGEVHKRNEVDRCHHPFRRGFLSSIVVKATGSPFLLSVFFFSRTIGLRVYLRQGRTRKLFGIIWSSRGPGSQASRSRGDVELSQETQMTKWNNPVDT